MTKVCYLGHSGFTVETDNYFLVFDYVESHVDDSFGIIDVVEQKKIDFSKIKKPVIMFNSHEHFDHYNASINRLYSRGSNFFTILGDIESNFQNTKSMKPREYFKYKDIEVYTGSSTDVGVCFLIKVDGVVIYFAGDNIDWGDIESGKNYYNEIDYLASICSSVDIAFVPVCNYFGEMSKSITDSAIYAIEKLNAKKCYPMHCALGKQVYGMFEDEVKSRKIKTDIAIL